MSFDELLLKINPNLGVDFRGKLLQIYNLKLTNFLSLESFDCKLSTNRLFGYHLIIQFKDFDQNLYFGDFMFIDFGQNQSKSNSSVKIIIFISKFSFFSLFSKDIIFLTFSHLFLFDFTKNQSLVKVNILTLTFDFSSPIFFNILKMSSLIY